MGAAGLTPQDTRIGPGRLAELGDVLGRLKPRTAMLVTGVKSYARSGANSLAEKALAGMEVHRFSGVTANPNVVDVESGVALWRIQLPDIIVAIGGGSVLDTAKLIGLLGPADRPWRAFCATSSGHDSPATYRVPLIAIPTTAGSGAEATRFATFYVAGEKRSIAHGLLRPSHAIVDSLLTASMPPGLTAVTGLDALAQAVESLWAVASTRQSRELAAAALANIAPTIGRLVQAPTPRLRERMARGAHLAGRAIDISRTTAAHALSYPLTAHLGVAHGHAVALLLPLIFRINAHPEGRAVRDPRGPAHLAASIDRIAALLGCRNRAQAACFLQKQLEDLGLAASLAGRALPMSAACLAGQVDPERLRNNPVVLSAGDVHDIYARLLCGGDIE